MANVNAADSPFENGSEIRCGKNFSPVSVSWFACDSVDRCGPTSSLMGLYPRNAANRMPTVGRFATALASDCETPLATSPPCIADGRSLDRPAIIRLKNNPIDSTIAAFWNVVIIPAPEPRALAGRLFITSARLGMRRAPCPLR